VTWFACREGGGGGVASRQVERAMVVDDEGRVVLVERETTGVTLETEHGGRAVTVVQTAVRGLVLGSVRDRQQQQPVPDDEHMSCCSCILRCLLGVVCLPCLLVYACCSCCCKDD